LEGFEKYLFNKDFTPTSTISMADSNIEPSQGRCQLLELPVELRTLILAELIQPEELEIFAKIRKKCLQNQRTAPSSWVAIFVYKSIWPAVLRTCRQIYEENKALLFQPTRISLVADQDWCVHHTLRTRPMRLVGLSGIREMCIRIVALATTDRWPTVTALYFIKYYKLEQKLRRLDIYLATRRVDYWDADSQEKLKLFLAYLPALPSMSLGAGQFLVGKEVIRWRKDGKGEWREISRGEFYKQWSQRPYTYVYPTLPAHFPADFCHRVRSFRSPFPGSAEFSAEGLQQCIIHAQRAASAC
jgi:hypothetical protein